ncbi:MAG: hypothetical protein M1820_001184 [Bogoriella megaspora]|nr:MAG: hypothetical protein M1820_001184 [Bogoriella megaspora]
MSPSAPVAPMYSVKTGNCLKYRKRQVKRMRDNIQSISRGEIRRLARRGGVFRFTEEIYPTTRKVLYDRLKDILSQVVALVEHRGKKTIQVRDVIFVLSRMGNPIYGFDPETNIRNRPR